MRSAPRVRLHARDDRGVCHSLFMSALGRPDDAGAPAAAASQLSATVDAGAGAPASAPAAPAASTAARPLPPSATAASVAAASSSAAAMTAAAAAQAAAVSAAASLAAAVNGRAGVLAPPSAGHAVRGTGRDSAPLTCTLSGCEYRYKLACVLQRGQALMLTSQYARNGRAGCGSSNIDHRDNPNPNPNPPTLAEVSGRL